MVKNKKIIIFLTTIVIISISVFYISTNFKKTQQNIPVKVYSSIDAVVPGVTTVEDLSESIGPAIASSSGKLYYKSTSPTRNHEISIQKNVVSFVKEVVSYKDSTNLSDLQSIYGELNFLYGKESVNGYYLYYDPEKSIAYIANPITGTVLELWRFPATNFENFKNLYAREYSETPLKGQF